MAGTVATQMKAIDFTSDIAKLTQGFTGRQWVFDDIDRWLRESDERFFILIGEPGVGKSAIAAQLTQTRKDIASYHFCIARQISTVEPNNVLLSLAAQLIKYFPDYGEALVNTVKPLFLQVNVKINIENIRDSVVQGVVIENLHIHYPKQALNIMLRQALAALPNPPKAPVSIVIDSLDEAVTYSKENNLVTLLSSVDDLPSWVRFILTSRPDEQRVLSYFKTLKPHYYDLNELSEKNKKDIHQYVDGRVVSELIQAQIQKFQVPSEALINQITELSEGNFLYTKVLLDDIELGGQPLDNLVALPRGLNELYHNFLLRLKAEWEGKYQPIFGILTVTKAPVTEEELTNLLSEQLDETELGQRLRVVQQFLDVAQNDYAENTYTLFHQSFQDYLVDKKKSGVFYCSPKDGHRQIIEYCWQYHPCNWWKCDRYGLRYLTTHLVDIAALEKSPVKAEEYIARLHELLFNFDWLQAKLDATKVNALIADFDFSSNAPASLVQGAIRLSAHILAQDKTQLAGQLLGRLLSYEILEIQTMLGQAKQRSAFSWLRPLTPSLTSPDEPLIRTFTGHSGSVWSIAVTPDGEQIISGSQDGTIKIWNLNSGNLVCTILAHNGSVNAVSITPDGLQVISGSHDRTIKVWDLKTRELVHTLTGHYGSVNAVVLAPDGSKLISGSSDCSLKVWNLKTGEVLHTLVGHRASVQAVTVTKNKKWVVSGSYNDVLRVWNLETGKEEFTLGKRDTIRSIAVLDEERVISASEDGTITIWKVRTWEKERTLNGLSKSVRTVAVTPDFQQIISGSSDGTITVWKVGTWEKGATFTAHTAWVLAVAATPDGKQIISASGNNLSNENLLKVWNMEKCSKPFSFNNKHRAKKGHSDSVEVTAFTPGGNEVVSASKDGSLKIWEVETWENTATFVGQSKTAEALGDYEHHKYFNLEADEVKCFLHSTRNTLPYLLTTTANGKLQVWASKDETLKVWDASARQFIASFTGESEINCCAVSLDGVTIIAGEASGRIHFLRLEGV